MPLFISNSDRHNKATWAVTWALVIGIFLLFMVTYESFLKHKGFVPSVTDNKKLWSYYRSKTIGGPNKLAIIGASRSQLNLNIPYLKKQLNNYDILQLSINAQYPMATLAALANDAEFTGVVLMSMNAQALESNYLSMQQAYNDYYQGSPSFEKLFNAYITAQCESYFRFLHPSLGIKKIINYYDRHKKLPQPTYTTANLDRSISANYKLADTKQLLQFFYHGKQKNYQDDPPTPFELWQNNIPLLKNYINSIEQRGGRVILFRFPTDKGHWQLDEQYYPRTDYWNKISNDPHITAIHFNDINGMRDFDLPDSSHIDQSQTQAFTELLLRYLMDNELITP